MTRTYLTRTINVCSGEKTKNAMIATAAAVTAVGIFAGILLGAKASYDWSCKKAEKTYDRFIYLTELADVDKDGKIQGLEDTLLRERLPLLEQRSIDSITADDLLNYGDALGYMPEQYRNKKKQIEDAIKAYEKDL